MSIASQYVRAAAAKGVLPPVAGGVMTITGGFTAATITETVEVSTVTTGSESISESVTVTVT